MRCRLNSIGMLLNVGKYSSGINSVCFTTFSFEHSKSSQLGTCPQVTRYTLLTHGAYFSTARYQYLKCSHVLYLHFPFPLALLSPWNLLFSACHRSSDPSTHVTTISIGKSTCILFWFLQDLTYPPITSNLEQSLFVTFAKSFVCFQEYLTICLSVCQNYPSYRSLLSTVILLQHMLYLE